ncbi:hypothetical protein BGX28_004972, partial [Mortierella sp. GBA30]
MSGRKSAVDSLTPKHVAYLGLMHMFGAMVLDGIINFALATAMYKNTSNPVMIWVLPNTLAGEAAVTIIIQTTLTWILDRLAVAGDLKKGLVAPLRMPRNPHPWFEWFVGLDDVPVYAATHKKRIRHALEFHGKRIVVLILMTFLVFWPLTIGMLTWMRGNGIGKDPSPLSGDFNAWPFPEIFKGVFGFATGIITPFVSYIALIYQGETLIRVSSFDSDQEEEQEDDDDGDEDMVMEDLQRR